MDKFDNFKKLLSNEDVINGVLPNDDELSSADKFNAIVNYKGWFALNVDATSRVIYIYNNYIKQYGHDFVKENALTLENKTAKAWVLYALEKYGELISISNKTFEEEIENLQRQLNVVDVNLMDVVKKYMPFLTNRNVFKFALEHMDSPELNYFYILLIAWYENICPRYPFNYCGNKYPTCEKIDRCPFVDKCKRKDNDFVRELHAFQKQITVDFLSSFPQKAKSKALVKLYESFKQINNVGVWGYKLCLSYEKILYPQGRPLSGDFYIGWDNVEFYNGFYLISHPNVSLDKKVFYKIEDRSSRKIFNDINKLFLKRLFPIYVKAEKGQIVKVLNNANLRECISILEHKINITFTKKERKDRTKVEKRELTISEAKDLCKELKSRYLDNLCVRQLENYKVICCIEHRINSSGVVHDEYSFIFTVKESKEKIYLVYENAANSRSTYILPIAKGTWGDSIEHIYNFFASDEVNKRQQMASRLVDLKLPGKYEYKRVFHTDYYSWNCKIRELLMDAKVCL